MKFFNQQGDMYHRTHLAVSDNLCKCCTGFDHAATEYHDDAVCKKCGALCRCGCHRTPTEGGTEGSA